MGLIKIITYSQVILSVLLIAGILLQQKGTGLSSAFGGGSIEYSTKRGAEKIVFYTTIVIATLFIAVSIARILLA